MSVSLAAADWALNWLHAPASAGTLLAQSPQAVMEAQAEARRSVSDAEQPPRPGDWLQAFSRAWLDGA